MQILGDGFVLKFTPHARGSTSSIMSFITPMSIYPACAGINLSDCPICGGRIHLPRVCGDQPREGAAFEQVSQFTPHARGSTLNIDAGTLDRPIYPACAGINLGYADESGPKQHLPRMRGDQP